MYCWHDGGRYAVGHWGINECMHAWMNVTVVGVAFAWINLYMHCLWWLGCSMYVWMFDRFLCGDCIDGGCLRVCDYRWLICNMCNVHFQWNGIVSVDNVTNINVEKCCLWVHWFKFDVIVVWYFCDHEYVLLAWWWAICGWTLGNQWMHEWMNGAVVGVAFAWINLYMHCVWLLNYSSYVWMFDRFLCGGCIVGDCLCVGDYCWLICDICNVHWQWNGIVGVDNVT